jgi:hypothetical protein
MCGEMRNQNILVMKPFGRNSIDDIKMDLREAVFEGAGLIKPT